MKHNHDSQNTNAGAATTAQKRKNSTFVRQMARMAEHAEDMGTDAGKDAAKAIGEMLREFILSTL